MEIFGIPLQGFLSQLLLGLVNGSFYAMLSLGLAVIFGLLGIVNFAHGALYMIGAYVAWLGLEKLGINYWASLIVAPLVVGAIGVAIERTLLRRLYRVDPIYGLLLTFGLAQPVDRVEDRKSTRLNSSHEWISYAVFRLKKKKAKQAEFPRRSCRVKPPLRRTCCNGAETSNSEETRSKNSGRRVRGRAATCRERAAWAAN